MSGHNIINYILNKKASEIVFNNTVEVIITLIELVRCVCSSRHARTYSLFNTLNSQYCTQFNTLHQYLRDTYCDIE